MSREKVLPMSQENFVTYVPERFRIQELSAMLWMKIERAAILLARHSPPRKGHTNA